MTQVNLPVYLFVLGISAILVGYFLWQLYIRVLRRGSKRVVTRPAPAVNSAQRTVTNRTPVARMRRVEGLSSGESEDESRPFVRRRQGELEDNSDSNDHQEAPKQKIGVKKAAKLAEKARRKEDREAEERYREEQRILEDEEIARRNALEKAEEDAIAAQEAAEAKRREEEAAREQAEYERLKMEFAVEDEGTDAPATDPKSISILNQQLIATIHAAKVVPIEHLSLEFGMKTEACIDKLNQLLSSGQLTGVLDDRGKFVYITPDEYEEVAKFIEKRGKVTLRELAQHGTKLIRTDAAK